MQQLPTDYQNFIHLSRYARWRDDLGRRENWSETVDRYFDFFVPYLIENHDIKEELIGSTASVLKQSIMGLENMPSMRALMTAGPALARDHVAGYNCAYLPIDDPRAFDETLFILMCGTGVGFSVERQYVNKLPPVPNVIEQSDTVLKVRDSKRGWAETIRELVAMLYAGRIPRIDISGVRLKGARLQTMGGRASGPQPLQDLADFIIHIFQQSAGRQLTSIDCHDIVCKIGECVVVGGVRRSALISLSNLSDQRMRDAKKGEWYLENNTPWRALANNSVAYTEKPEVGQFMQEWNSLYDSKSGERGMFSRTAARNQAMASGRRKGFWDEAQTDPIGFGTNPCSEIILRPGQFCNLSEIVVRPNDTVESLHRKARNAAILGTWQACLTNFRYLRSHWRDNCEEERLLGVSMTGIMDGELTNGNMRKSETADLLERLKDTVNATNAEWSGMLGIAPAAATTCVKPSGTASQLVMSGSGIHSWHAPRYVRTVRQDNKDPVTLLMKDAGFPHEPDITKPDHTTVFAFPMTAPETAVFRDDRSAIEELEHWKLYQDHWCEHKPSVTITVREDEWPAVGAWVWGHFDQMSGVSFLPHSDHSYKQAPYQIPTEEMFEILESSMPTDVDWDRLSEFEKDDEHVKATREFACTGDKCDIA